MNTENTLSDERILVCISSSPSNKKIIKTAAQMANAFRADFSAVYVEVNGFSALGAREKASLYDNLRYAKDITKSVSTLYGDDIASELSRYARLNGITKIVLGKSNTKWRHGIQLPSVADRLVRLLPETDIIIIPNDLPSRDKSGSERKHAVSLKDVAVSIAVLAAATAIGFGFRALGFSDATIITIYILGVLAVSFFTDGYVCGSVSSVVNVLVFNFLFTEPRFSLQAYATGYPVTFVIMFIASFLTSSLTSQVKKQAQKHAQNAYRTEVLLSSNRKLQLAGGKDEILLETARQLQKLLYRSVIMYPEADGGLGLPIVLNNTDLGSEAEKFNGEKERAAALWSMQNGAKAGATTPIYSDAHCLYLTIKAKDTIYAVAGLPIDKGDDLDVSDRNLLLAMLGESGVALEKERLDRMKNELAIRAEQEQLRSNLLRAISHDLRTPLTSISGNASMLLDGSIVKDEQTKKQLYSDIYDDSLWLIRLVENLLSITRMDDNRLSLSIQPELISDVIEEAISHVRGNVRKHIISVNLSDKLLMAKMDASLIVQVLVNLIDNAVKYTRDGSSIVISAAKENGIIKMSVADDGDGVADSDKEKLFDMFYTANGSRTVDGRRGLGLGLALCKSIVNAHGGDISVRDNLPRGTVFEFTLIAEEVGICE
ncbi:MAG: DUF4118 domain-containing protein [Oscillospiraceae bacterium]